MMEDRGNYEDRHTPDTGVRRCQPRGYSLRHICLAYALGCVATAVAVVCFFKWPAFFLGGVPV